MLKRWTNKTEAIKIACPACGAGPGEACKQDPVKTPSHMARHEAAIERGAKVVKHQDVPNPSPELAESA